MSRAYCHGIGAWKQALGCAIGRNPDDYIDEFIGSISLAATLQEWMLWVVDEITELRKQRGSRSHTFSHITSMTRKHGTVGGTWIRPTEARELLLPHAARLGSGVRRVSV